MNDEQRTKAEALLSGTAWRAFCDRLKVAGDVLLEPRFPDDPRTRTEGYRALLRLLNYATRLEIEAGDPDFPDFVRYEEPHSQWGGPNPDNTYLRARIDPRATYRVWADVDGMLQAIFCQHEGDMQLGQFGVYHERHLEDLEVDTDGFLEMILSPDPHEGNWIPTHPDARLFTIRIYVSDWIHQTAPTFHIERIGAEGLAPAPLAPEALAAGLERAADWIERTSVFWNDFIARSLAASTPNVPSAARVHARGR